MVVDEYGNHRFYGIYRAIVQANNDPIKQGRLKLTVPQVLFDQVTSWAWPIFPNSGSGATVPAVGDIVWVSFEGGDPSFPVCIYGGTGGGGATGYLPYVYSV